jgi:hypothetical protein
MAYPVLSAEARTLAARCERRVNELARRMARDAFERLPGYPELPAEVKDVEVAATVRNGLRLFLRRVRENQGRPGDLTLFKERAAQRAEEGMPLHTLLRSHSTGVYVLWQALRDEAGTGEEGALVELVDFLLRGHEAIIGAVAETYLDEQAALLAERREHHRSLVRGLLGGSLDPVRAFQELGLEGRTLVFHIHLPARRDRSASAVAERRVVRRVQTVVDRTLGPEAVSLLGTEGGHVIISRPAGTADDHLACEELAVRLRQVCGDDIRLAAITAGAPHDVPSAARTATDVVRVARACGRPAGLHRMDDVLLEYHLSRRDASSHRITALLAPLDDRPELVTTLRVYLELAQDRRGTAHRLGVHPNTVDNRLTRIGDLTGLDLTSPRGHSLALAALLLRDEPPLIRTPRSTRTTAGGA